MLTSYFILWLKFDHEIKYSPCSVGMNGDNDGNHSVPARECGADRRGNRRLARCRPRPARQRHPQDRPDHDRRRPIRRRDNARARGQPVLARALSLPARMAAPRRQLLGVGTWPHRPPPMKISEGPYEDGAKTPLPLELVSRTLINLKLESSLRRYYLLASRRNMVRWYVSARRGPTRQSGTGVTGKQLPTAQHLCQIRSGGRLDRMSVEHRQWGRETPYWLQCKTT